MENLRYKTENGEPPFRGVPPSYWHNHGITDSPLTATMHEAPADEPPFGGNVTAYLEHQKQQEVQQPVDYAYAGGYVDLSAIYGGYGHGGSTGVFYDPATGTVFSNGNYNGNYNAPAPVIQVQTVAATQANFSPPAPTPIKYTTKISTPSPPKSEKKATVHLIESTVAPWDKPGMQFSWRPFTATTTVKIKDLVEAVCPKLAPEGKKVTSKGITTCLENGEGVWLKDQEFWTGDMSKDDAAMKRRVEQTISEVGWSGDRGGGRPVWLVCMMTHD